MTVTLMLILVTGCSILSTAADDRNQLAVQYATLKVLEQNNVTNERILELTAKAKNYIQSDVDVAVANLVDEARSRLVSSGIPIADRLLIEAILSRAQEKIEAKLGDGVLVDEQKLQLLTVISWIEDAAKLNQ